MEKFLKKLSNKQDLTFEESKAAFEILMNGKYGQLIEIGDQLGMSKAIINVFEGKWKNANINGLEKKYNLEKLVNQYLDKPVFNNENN